MLRSAASPGSRGVRPVGRRYEWPPHDTATDRPPLRRHARLRAGLAPDLRRRDHQSTRGMSGASFAGSAVYLILPSRNSTCFLATGSYFFFTSLSVMVREFFRVT